MKIPNLNPLRWIRLAKAAPLLGRRCILLQEKITILEMHLAINRSMLAATMRERDKFEAALDLACTELAQLKKERREERRQIRTWITRFLTMTPSRN